MPAHASFLPKWSGYFFILFKLNIPNIRDTIGNIGPRMGIKIGIKLRNLNPTLTLHNNLSSITSEKNHVFVSIMVGSVIFN